MTSQSSLLNLLAFGLIAGLIACKDDDTSDPDDTNPEGDADTDADGDGDADPDAPWIEEADAYCYLHETGDQFYLWEVNCTADDPQGSDTIKSFDATNSVVTVLNDGGTTVATYALVCTDEGACVGSFKETDDGVSCASATSYTIRFQVVDEDDNVSAPYDVQGRQR
ncbi:MAG: hypothetical protein ABIO70_32015 [Pseudomonadota bacterium]